MKTNFDDLTTALRAACGHATLHREDRFVFEFKGGYRLTNYEPIYQTYYFVKPDLAPELIEYGHNKPIEQRHYRR